MPTPFMHLSMAQKLMARPELNPDLKNLVQAHWPAFCLGSIAVDFQQICDLRRRETHFYKTPPEPGDTAAFERMLVEYPELADAGQMTAEQAVFLAGYGAHLYYDLIWFHNVVRIFLDGDWGDPMARFTGHNLLLADQDQRSVQILEAGMGETLLAVNPAGWLPFDPENHLLAWQTLVADQLMPGAETQTIPIFSKRIQQSAEQVQAWLSDDDWRQANLFAHVSQALLDEVLERSIIGAIDLISTFLAPLNK